MLTTRPPSGSARPAQQAIVELHYGDSVREAATDTLGRFSFVNPTGPVQVAAITSDNSRVLTEWMVV